MNKTTNYIIQIVAVVVLVVSCAILFPHKTSNFKYHFEIGKPWVYSLLTAEQDFPIFKTEEQLRQETDQVLRDFTPYYNISSAVLQQQTELIMQSSAASSLNKKTTDYLNQQLKKAYQLGIIDPQEQIELNEQKYKKITIIGERHIAKTARVGLLYTPKTAYSMIMNNATHSQQSSLKKLQLETYIIPNLSYDSTTTEIVRESLIADISPTEGIIQKGEKIIDKGEIVDERAYQILSSIQRAYDEKETDKKSMYISTFASICLLCVIVSILIVYLLCFRRHLLTNFKNVWLITILMLTVIILSSLTLRYTKISVYIVPLAWTAIIVRVFIDSRTAFIVNLTTTLILALFVNAPLEFIILQTAAGLVAVGSLKEITQRAQLAQTTLFILITYSLTYTIYTLFASGDYHILQPSVYLCFAVNALLLICSYGLIYLFEKLFGFVSSITLVELTNVNNNLLREFAEKAPGSFQHSMQVSTLAFEAAQQIGANALLVRAGALYHDIGKLNHPHLFTENQIDHINPLNAMQPQEAAQKIIAHVADGLQIAKKRKLPRVIQTFILTHHGTSKVRYFYNSYVNAHPNEEVDEALFTYQGPVPNSKETAILMMADAVEARSRSLEQYTEESIHNMVEQMVQAQINEKQFRQTPLSFADVEQIKQVFEKRLISINHHRIAYPELSKPSK